VVRAIAAALIEEDQTRLNSLGPAIEWLEAESRGQSPAIRDEGEGESGGDERIRTAE
jgi:hypothetical protein